MTNSQAASVESVIHLVKDFSLGTSSIQEIRAEVTRLAEQGDAEDEWRRLALQFDGHRMQAMSWLNLAAKELPAIPAWKALREFLSAPPLDGESVLAERIAKIAEQGAASQAVQAEPVEVRFKYEGLTPVKGYDAIYAEYSTTFGRYPDAFMAKVVSQVKQDLFMWWGAHREKIRAGLVLLEAQDADRAARVSPAQAEPLWYLIEKAPRDGTWFKAKSIHTGEEKIVHFAAPYDRLPTTDSMGESWGNVPTHFQALPLNQTADEFPEIREAMEKVTPQSADENARLRNVIQVACIDGVRGLEQAWAKYFPDQAISIAQEKPARMLTSQEIASLYEQANSSQHFLELFLRKFCEVNAGCRIPAEGKLEGKKS